MKTKIRLPCEALAATTEAVVALIGVVALLVPMLVVTVTARAHPRAIPLRAVPAGGLLEAGELKEGWQVARQQRSPGWPLRASLKERPRPGACRPASCRRRWRG
jgi:hypothetical protein